jgi:hypothetical protein
MYLMHDVDFSDELERISVRKEVPGARHKRLEAQRIGQFRANHLVQEMQLVLLQVVHLWVAHDAVSGVW